MLYFHTLHIGVVIRKQLWKFQCPAGFSIKMNEKGVGLLGRSGFFDLFEEVGFNQNKRMLRLKGDGSRALEEFEQD